MICLRFAVFSYCLITSLALDLSGCGTNKSCIYSPSGCSATSPTCLVFTYAYNSVDNTFNLEMSGGSGGGSQYVGAAFSLDNQMTSADLYYCTGNELKSAVITTQTRPTTENNLPTGTTNVVAQTVGGVGECTFTRPASVTKDISGTQTTFDLASTQYFVLQAFGEYTGNLLQYHSTSRRNSSGPYNFAGPVLTTTTASATASTASTTTSTASTTASTASTTVSTVSGPAVDDTSGCGTSKGCFFHPDSCTVGSDGCKFLSWAYNAATSTFDFVIVGGATGQYAGTAFGSEQGMANADLYFCTQTGLSSGIIITTTAPTVQAQLPAEITNVQSMVSNGALRCSFTRAASVTKSISSGPTAFNLQTTQYYLLYAVGTSSNGGLSYHGGKAANRILSTSTIDFKTNEVIGGSGGADTVGLIKAHASLMLVAWMTCASIGVILARHFKPLWHKKKLFDKQIWFQLHRGLMITAFLCTVIAFILAFVAVGGYSTVGAHPVIGIIVTGLVFINPLMALFRPHPGTPRRPIFNWAHWFVGSAARILAIVAIFLGVDLTRLDLPERNTWVLVGFVCFHVLTEIILEIVSAVYGHIAVYKKPVKTDTIDMGDDNSPSPTSEAPPQGAAIKYVILVLYAVINVAFLIFFLINIANN